MEVTILNVKKCGKEKHGKEWINAWAGPQLMHNSISMLTTVHGR